MKAAGSLLLTILTLASCSNPLDKQFNRATAEADFTRIVTMGLIDSAQAKTMARFMVRNNLIGAQVLEIGATYGDILEEAVKQEQTGADTNQKNQAERATQSAQVLLDIVADSTHSDGRHVIYLSMNLENISGKTMVALKGSVRLLDPFGDEIQSKGYALLEPLGPNQRRNRVLQLEINSGNTQESIVEFSNTAPLKAVWVAEKVLLKE